MNDTSRIKNKRRSGQTAVALLFLSAIIVTLVTGFISLAALFLQLSLRSQNELQAFSIAEAGIEYYRWHLAHAPQDFTDGTGHPGPYVHNYYDKDGIEIGQFSLAIVPPPTGSTVVTITSTGTVLADGSIKKIITVQMGISSILDYSLAINNNLLVGRGTVVYGTLFSNGGIEFNGLAYGPVESAVSTWSDANNANKTEWGVYTTLPPADPQPPTPPPARPDVFTAGRYFPVPAVDFSGISQNLATLKSIAQASGTYYGPSGAYGYQLSLATSGIYTMDKVTALVPAPNGCTNTSNVSGWGIWSVGSTTFVATGTIPLNGIIFSEDDLWVKGQIQNAHLTIAAGRFPSNASTWANITVNSSTLYTDYNGSDTIAYVAQNNFNVGLYSDNVLRIDGAIIAQNGRIGRFYYSPPNDGNNSNKCGPTVMRQLITLYGDLITNGQYGFGFDDGTGYQNKDIIYDSNLPYNPPPDLLQTANQYSILSWTEVQ
jgi:hypothetical protein